MLYGRAVGRNQSEAYCAECLIEASSAMRACGASIAHYLAEVKCWADTELTAMFRLLAFFCFLIASQIAYAEQVRPGLPFLCDDQSGAVFVSINPERKPSAKAHWQERSVDWQALLKVGPGKNQGDDSSRLGSRIASVRCGGLTLRFASGFLNANPQGELGALDFPLIEILKGKRVLLSQTALEPCAVPMSRYNYFGACPSSWAESIELTPHSRGMQIKVLRVFSDAEFNDVERVDVYDDKIN